MTKRVSHSSKKSYYLRQRRSSNFFSAPWAGGTILVIFAGLALLLANMPETKEWYKHFIHANFTIGFSEFAIVKSVEEWVNDGMMVIFFFVVGLEIKREIIAGQLSSIKEASLPVAAAIGGMIVPALIYALFNNGTEYQSGWGIPMATDIAFAIGVLSLLGNRVPLAMKIFLTALAIVDDLGAILVIAIFYTVKIDFMLLGLSSAILLLLWGFNRSNIYNMWYYIVPSIVLWVLFLYSGIHSTIAGVLVAMTIPASARFSKKYFTYKIKYFQEAFIFNDRSNKEVLSNEKQFHDLNSIRYIAANTSSPSQRLEHMLFPFVTFLIMPLFALVNAGVDLSIMSQVNVFDTTQGLGIILGLVLGKPLGITLFCFMMVKAGWAVLPKHVSWSTLLGVSCLGGIGFTMSIFIDNLAFAGTVHVDSGKIAVLAASLTAAVFGAIMINLVVKKGKS